MAIRHAPIAVRKNKTRILTDSCGPYADRCTKNKNRCFLWRKAYRAERTAFFKLGAALHP